MAQIGETAYRPKHLEWTPCMAPDTVRERARDAQVIVSHAGMGSILTALELGKPIVVIPRRANLGEHRNDHQVATAVRMRELGRVAVAMDEAELITALDGLGTIQAGSRIGPFASDEMIVGLRSWIEDRLREPHEARLDAASPRLPRFVQSFLGRLRNRGGEANQVAPRQHGTEGPLS